MDALAQFNDSLAARRASQCWRGIGHPMAFLDRIGITPIQEGLAHGKTLINIAEELNVSVVMLRNWVEDRGHELGIEKGEIASAEGYLWRGEKMLVEANNPFQLSKARLMLQRGEFMAKKKNKSVYGDQITVDNNATTVSYQFIVDATRPVPPIRATKDITPATSEKPELDEPVTLELPAFREGRPPPFREGRPPPFREGRRVDTWGADWPDPDDPDDRDSNVVLTDLKDTPVGKP